MIFNLKKMGYETSSCLSRFLEENWEKEIPCEKFYELGLRSFTEDQIKKIEGEKSKKIPNAILFYEKGQPSFLEDLRKTGANSSDFQTYAQKFEGAICEAEWLFQAQFFQQEFKGPLCVFVEDMGDIAPLFKISEKFRFDVSFTMNWKYLQMTRMIIGYGKSERYQQLLKEREKMYSRSFGTQESPLLSRQRFFGIVHEAYQLKDQHYENCRLNFEISKFNMSLEDAKSEFQRNGVLILNSFLKERSVKYFVENLPRFSKNWYERALVQRISPESEILHEKIVAQCEKDPDSSIDFFVSGRYHCEGCVCYACSLTFMFCDSDFRTFFYKISGNGIHQSKGGLTFCFESDHFLEKCPERYLILYFFDHPDKNVLHLKSANGRSMIQPAANSIWFFDTEKVQVSLFGGISEFHGVYFFIRERTSIRR